MRLGVTIAGRPLRLAERLEIRWREADAYTVEIVIMHRMIMHKSHIAWVFLGTKLSKHGIVP